MTDHANSSTGFRTRAHADGAATSPSPANPEILPVETGLDARVVSALVGGSGLPPADPRRQRQTVLALQRTVGNRAVMRVLAREHAAGCGGCSAIPPAASSGLPSSHVQRQPRPRHARGTLGAVPGVPHIDAGAQPGSRTGDHPAGAGATPPRPATKPGAPAAPPRGDHSDILGTGWDFGETVPGDYVRLPTPTSPVASGRPSARGGPAANEPARPTGTTPVATSPDLRQIDALIQADRQASSRVMVYLREMEASRFSVAGDRYVIHDARGNSQTYTPDQALMLHAALRESLYDLIHQLQTKLDSIQIAMTHMAGREAPGAYRTVRRGNQRGGPEQIADPALFDRALGATFVFFHPALRHYPAMARNIDTRLRAITGDVDRNQFIASYQALLTEARNTAEIVSGVHGAGADTQAAEGILWGLQVVRGAAPTVFGALAAAQTGNATAGGAAQGTLDTLLNIITVGTERLIGTRPDPLTGGEMAEMAAQGVANIAINTLAGRLPTARIGQAITRRLMTRGMSHVLAEQVTGGILNRASSSVVVVLNDAITAARSGSASLGTDPLGTIAGHVLEQVSVQNLITEMVAQRTGIRLSTSAPRSRYAGIGGGYPRLSRADARRSAGLRREATELTNRAERLEREADIWQQLVPEAVRSAPSGPGGGPATMDQAQSWRRRAVIAREGALALRNRSAQLQATVAQLESGSPTSPAPSSPTSPAPAPPAPIPVPVTDPSPVIPVPPTQRPAPSPNAPTPSPASDTVPLPPAQTRPPTAPRPTATDLAALRAQIAVQRERLRTLTLRALRAEAMAGSPQTAPTRATELGAQAASFRETAAQMRSELTALVRLELVMRRQVEPTAP